VMMMTMMTMMMMMMMMMMTMTMTMTMSGLAGIDSLQWECYCGCAPFSECVFVRVCGWVHHRVSYEIARTFITIRMVVIFL